MGEKLNRNKSAKITSNIREYYNNANQGDNKWKKNELAPIRHDHSSYQ